MEEQENQGNTVTVQRGSKKIYQKYGIEVLMYKGSYKPFHIMPNIRPIRKFSTASQSVEEEEWYESPRNQRMGATTKNTCPCWTVCGAELLQKILFMRKFNHEETVLEILPQTHILLKTYSS